MQAEENKNVLKTIIAFRERIFSMQEWKINIIIKNKVSENKNKIIFKKARKDDRK